MDKETQDYYENYFSLFQHAGWKQLMEDLEETEDSFSLINIKDAKELHFAQGQLHILNQLRVDYSSDTIALFGGELPGTLIANHLSSLNKSLFWFADDYRKDLTNLVPYKYDKVESMFEANDVKVILFAEHSNPIQLKIFQYQKFGIN